MWDWFSAEWFTLSKLSGFAWVHPYYLYGIAATPVAFWLRNVLHARSFQRLGITFISSSTAQGWSAWLRILFPITGFLAITNLLIALARPQLINTVTERDAEVIDIVLAMDISDSMLEKDLLPNRLIAAKSVAKSFIGGRLQDRIGLVIFAGEAFTLCPLTNDYELLYGFLEEVNQRMILVAGTAIGSALAVCINRLRESTTKSKVIILLSDGENTAGNLNPITAAKLAKAFSIRVYTIAIGKGYSGRIVKDSLAITLTASDEGTLQKIAKATNGKFYRATDNMVLTDIFQQIDRLERVSVKNRTYQEVKDYYRIYLNWSITLLLVMIFLKVVFIANVLED